ncbi:serine/threonine-protein kinase [Gloeobacter violaceus]|uniref:Serine/threonine kinase n=1 Tax=Gloeobacter violaceus (strain ATCC 29082 / PCC 7421) TaxID=251221 RepID=Q7NN29_GLOVI|nr:serine/threonine-protein kinase [Gloeobacter violaceus]BAC88526.1 serine/threonine kinase [Gloeobacter violaceus PCC 7421]
MTPEQWQQLSEILGDALDYQGAERLAFLDGCKLEAEQRRFIDQLLTIHEQQPDFLSAPMLSLLAGLADEAVPVGAPLRAGQRLGAYRVVRELGRGGMGVVFLAERADGQFQKQVCIKVLQTGWAAALQVGRFLSERQILANLEHPYIARLIDGGSTEAGVPYLVMEFVDGMPIDRYCEAQQLGLRPRLELFSKVCQAVQYAHTCRVIHRDLKPSNILVNCEGEPRLLDFGIAKLLDPQGRSSEPTRTDLRVLTPRYASPEQIAGAELTPASDVYALGVVLYELITGQRPAGAQAAASYELAWTLSDQTALLPSRAVGEQPTRAFAPAAAEGGAQGLSRQLEGALDRIVLRSLSKPLDRRYATVGELLTEVRRYLDGAERTGMRPWPAGALARAVAVVALNGAAFWVANELTARSLLAGPGWFAAAGLALLAGMMIYGLAEAPRASGRRRRLAVGTVLLELGLLAGLFWAANPFVRLLSNPPNHAIAVLPFVNLGGDKQSAYFSAGMAVDITNQLGKIADLKVIASSAAAQYAESPKSLGEIARELGVSSVLTGSVRREGNKVRIVSQLVDPATGEQLWSGDYDRQLSDVFKIQEDVAQQIAGRLQAKLSPAEKERVTQTPTGNITAYDYYLKGREYFERGRNAENDLAIELFKRALALEPNYALAHAALGNAYFRKAVDYSQGDVWLEASLGASRKALAIDPQLGEAHRALGNGLRGKGFFRKAQDAYRRAIALAPNNAAALGSYGSVNFIRCELEEGVNWTLRAVALDPLSTPLQTNLGDFFTILGDDARARQALEAAVTLRPDDAYALWKWSQFYLLNGNFEAARQTARRLIEAEPRQLSGLYAAGDVERFAGNRSQARAYYRRILQGSGDLLAGTGYLLPTTVLGELAWRDSRRTEAKALLERSLKLDKAAIARGNEDSFYRFDLAAVYAVQGKRDEALRWLRAAVDEGYCHYRFLRREPVFASLHSDSEFLQLLKALEQRVEAMRVRVANL